MANEKDKSGKIEFIRDKDTGMLYAYKNGKKIGSVTTMGDDIKK